MSLSKSGPASAPARNVPSFLVELLNAFAASGQAPNFRAFLQDEGSVRIGNLIAKYQAVPPISDDQRLDYDWGANEAFSLAGRGPGECGAGVFDLIDVDLKSAAESLRARQCYPAAALAARALLVTRGEQAASDQEAFGLFEKHFLQPGLVDARFQPLVPVGKQAITAVNPANIFTSTEVAAFVGTVEQLFKSMDPTLHFAKAAPSSQPAVPVIPPPAPAVNPRTPADLQKDFRGVTCPLNYVKTKMALAQLKPGQTLSVLLDGRGAENVPDSATKDGHEIVCITPEGRDTRVIIRRAS